MEFSKHEYWSGLPFPFPGYLSDPGIEPVSLTLADGFFTTEPLGKPRVYQSPWILMVISIFSYLVGCTFVLLMVSLAV